MTFRRHLAAVAVLVAMLGFSVAPASAQIARRPVRPGPVAGSVQLPHTVSDAQGNQWMIYQGGWIQMQGNQPLYSQGAVLHINGNQPSHRGNQAKLDEKTGEIVLENINSGQFSLTRRILI